MPIGALKNKAYGLALPVLGKRCEWSASAVRSESAGNEQTRSALACALRKRRAVGACVQRFQNGALTDCYAFGNASLMPERRPVQNDTIFRTASVAKLVNALLVFRLQTLGKLDVCEQASDFLGYSVRNPHFPAAPLTLGMLLSHTSSLIDSPAYFASFSQPVGLKALLADSAAFSGSLPGLQFRYSNLGAGMIGCMLEKRFGESYEALMQRELFKPLGVSASFDQSTLGNQPVADSYGVLPFQRRFDAQARIRSAAPLDAPDPEAHYLLASGNLYLTAANLARLTLLAWNGGDGFINPQCLALMRTPTADWPQKEVRLRHGMGLLTLDDKAVCQKQLWGHQGFAYGAVNGVFFDAEGNGFCLLNSGVSEQRVGHLALVNRDLIKALL